MIEANCKNINLMIEELFAPKIPHDRVKYETEMKRKTFFHPNPIQVCYNVEDRKPIPLKDVNYNIKIMNGLTVVQIEQVYSTNENPKPIELEYLFTIKSNAVVINMIIELGDVIVHGVVKEKDEAKEEYDEGIKEGKTMAYCDQDLQFPEIKRIKIGSLSPNKTLKVKFEYIQPLEVFLNKFWKLEVSPMIDPSYTTTNSENFINHYQVKQVIRQYVNIQDFLFNFRQDIKVQIDVGQQITYLRSPTHLIDKINRDQEMGKQQNQQSKKVEVVLQNQIENFVANKQFTLLFSTENINLPNAILSHTDNDALQMEKYCATLTFIPKFNEVPLDDAYQQYVSGINTNDYYSKGNYLFFIDRSGSMAGHRIEKAKQSLILFLKSLPQDCSFNIISFGTRHKLMWNQSKSYNQEHLNDAIEKVEKMSADMQGTEIYKPLNEVVYKQNPVFMTNVFILTDGEVDVQPLIKLVQINNKPSIRIYPVGLGGDCSQYLIKRLAQISNGKYQFVNNNDNLNEKIIDLLEDAMSQTLQNFTFETDIVNVQKIVPDPQSIISLKNNQELTFQILFSSEKPQSYIKIGCFDPQNKKQIQYRVDLQIKDSQKNEYFHKLAAHKVISYYEQSIQNGEDYIQGVRLNKAEIHDVDIINISLQHQILCTKTAFICEICNVEDEFKPQTSEKIIVNTVRNFQEESYFQQYHIQSFSAVSATCVLGGVSGGRGGGRGGARGRIDSVDTKCKILSSKHRVLACIDEDEDEEDRSRSRSRSLEKKIITMQKKEKAKKSMKKQCDMAPRKQKIDFDEIVKHFNADGSFSSSSGLNLKIDKMKNLEKIKEELWHTILALFYLEINFPEKRREWQLLYRKSINYLKSKGINYEEKKNDYLQQYKILINE